MNRETEKKLNDLVDKSSLSTEEQTKMREKLKYISSLILLPGLCGGATVDRVFKGGSWKKGTILNTNYDVDLVVFLNCKFEDYVKVDFRCGILMQIANRLRASGVKITRESNFFITANHTGTEFDILTAFNAAKDSTKQNRIKSQRDNFASFLRIVPHLTPAHFSTCVSESSRKIITERDNNTTILIRAIKLAKIWNKKQFPNDVLHKKQLRSYALEIIMANLCDENRLNPKVSGPFLFYKMLELFSLLTVYSAKTISIKDFGVPVWNNPSARYLSVLDPCVEKSDIVSDFEDWINLIAKARTTKQELDRNNVNFL